MTPREIAARRAALRKASGRDVMLLSGATGQNLPEVVRTVMNRVHDHRAASLTLA